MNIRASFLGFGLAVGSSAFALAQDPPATPPMGDGQAAPKKPEVIFRNFREAYLEGKFDVASDTLREFLAANPSDSELIELDRKFGATFVLGLRNLQQWSDNPTANAEAKKAVEQLVAKIQAATKKTLQDPKRVTMLVRNLGASPGERLYAELELKRAGSAAVPIMIEVLRSTSDVATRTGILGAIPKLGPDAVPPLIAALDGLTDDLKSGIVTAIGTRADVLALTGKTDTDPLPHLWAFAGDANGIATLKGASKQVLETLVGNIERRRPADELVRLAMPITEGRSNYWATDATPGMIKIWQWDSTTNNVKSSEVNKATADEYFGLRALKWAVERSPGDETIQSAFLAFATTRAVERAKFADLGSSNPVVAGLLAAAPSEILKSLLAKGSQDKNAALAFGAIQAISARGSALASESTSRTGQPRPSLLVRALDFPDDRVQFAAAVALLRSGSKDHGANARVIDILKRTASIDAGSGASKAILADPSALRAGRVGEMFRQAGFDIERVGTTRDVLQRVRRAADVDLIVLDSHATEPLLIDFLTQLRASPISATIPVLVVASADQAKPLTAEPLLLRLALLIAATETEQVVVPPAFMADPRRPTKDNDRAKADALDTREKAIQRLYEVRLARLERLVAASNFPDSLDLQKRMRIRLPQLTYAALAAEYPVTPESAPDAKKKFDVYTKLIATQPELNAVAEKLPVADLIRLIEQLENVLTEETQKKFMALGKKIDPQALHVASVIERNPLVEARLAKDIRGFSKVRVVGEPYSATAIEEELKQGDAPAARAPGEKAAMAKTALEWLRKLAIGEVTGYDVRPADGVLRSALKYDDLAPIAVDALAKIGSVEAQQDLITTAITSSRPAPLRLQAADAAIRSVTAFGRLGTSKVEAAVTAGAANETNGELKSRFAALRSVIAGKPGDLAAAIKAFAPASLEPPAPKKVDEKKDPMTPPMGEEKPKVEN